MNRRRFLLTSLAGALAAPLCAEAQQAGKVFRIGLLGSVPVSDPAAARLWGGFIDGLRELGYVERQNVVIEGRFSEGRAERFPNLASDLVRLRVDIIVAAGPVAPLAAKQATNTIPIVMTNHGDPVGTGLVASLGRPGGNVTGLSILHPAVVGKQIEFLKQVVPKIDRVAVLTNPGNPTRTLMLREAKAALGLLQVLDVRGPSEFDSAFSAMRANRSDALLILIDPMLFGERSRLADLAAKHSLPAVSGVREFADAGILMTYGATLSHLFRRAAIFVNKILKGAKAADLPVEQPTTFEFVINLKTAKALGLTIPPSLLARTDQVLE
jgi:ABC-type uncharacterized transport system substrate-binding protein